MNAVDPSPMPTPDLGSLLRKPEQKPVSRPLPVRVLEAPPVEPAGDPKPTPRTSSTPGPSRTGAARARRTTKAGRQYRRTIAVYFPRELHRRLHAVAKERGTSATALALEAVNATHSELAEALAEQDGANVAGNDDLFDVPQARQTAEPSVPTTMRVTDSQHEALTALATDLSINRSRLISLAVALHLPGQ